MSDIEAQADELIALASIYDESAFTSQCDIEGLSTGVIKASVEVPQPFCVRLTGKAVEREVRHLPPVIVTFSLPVSYPSTDPPCYSVSCHWLSDDQIRQLRESLDELWCAGDVVLFTWINFLQNDVVALLSISSPLSVSADGLAAIIDHDAAVYKQEFESSVHTCEVCFTDKPGSKCVLLDVCRHVFCRDCMRDYCELHITEGSVNSLKCMMPKCASALHLSQVKELVSSALFDRYDRLLLQHTLDTMTDIMYCPRQACQCPVLTDENMATCPSCSYVFCIFCKMAYHGVSPCRVLAVNSRQLREEYLSADEPQRKLMEQRYGRKNIQRLVEDAFSEEWLTDNAKKCPQCRAHIQKVDGCNKMKCTKCNVYFCWLCMTVITADNPYTHFNSMSSPCFNKLFLGADLDRDDDDDELLWHEVGLVEVVLE